MRSKARSVDPGGVVEVLSQEVPLGAHARREDVLVGQVRLRPILEGEATMVTVTIQDRTASAIVEVRASRVVVEELVIPPETLEFERPTYRMGWQKTKELIVQAPADVVALHGTTITVSSSDPGVVVRGTEAELRFDDEMEYYRARVIVEARVLNAKAQINAELGDIVAVTHVTVTRKEEGPSFRIRIEDDEWGYWRAIIEAEPTEHGAEVRVVKIAGRHPAIRPFLGGDREGLDTPICRSVIAEVIADVMARQIVTELYRLRRNLEMFDADRLYREHYKRVSRFLPRIQRLLVGDMAVALRADTLTPLSLFEEVERPAP